MDQKSYNLLTEETTDKPLFYKLWMYVCVCTLFYTFFFQYAVISINNAMIILCGVNIIFLILHIMVNRKGVINKDPYCYLILFVFESFIMSYIFSGGMYGFDLGIRMIEYVLTGYSVFLLTKVDEKFFEVVIKTIFISISMLAFYVLLHGVVVTSSGALGLKNLNVNEMSSYFILMTACSFSVFVTRKEFFEKVLIIIADVIVIIAQISSASRRGFIMVIAILLLSILFGLIPYYTKINSVKRFGYYFFIILGVFIAFIILGDYIMNSTVLGARLGGQFDGGDELRNKYQSFAFQQFKNRPIFGVGIGGIAHKLGAYSHSMYYETISCTGIIGTFIFFYGVIKIGKELFITYFLNREETEFEYASLIARVGLIYWLGILASGIFVVMIYDFNFYMSMAILSSVISVSKNKINYEKRLLKL